MSARNAWNDVEADDDCAKASREKKKRDGEKEEAGQADRDQELGQLVRSNAFQISSRRRCREL